MIDFYLSQMAVLILKQNIVLSELLKSQIKSAPIKADIWHLRCEKDELLTLRSQLLEKLKNDRGSSALVLAQEEIEHICKKYT